MTFDAKRARTFDAKRASLKSPDFFRRFRVSGEGTPLLAARLKPHAQLLVFERGGERRALVREQMIYHHVAQGKLAGEPYLVTF